MVSARVHTLMRSIACELGSALRAYPQPLYWRSFVYAGIKLNATEQRRVDRCGRRAHVGFGVGCRRRRRARARVVLAPP